MPPEFKNERYNSNNENSGEAMYKGQRIKFKQVKSKVGGRFGATASVDFYYDEGLDVVTNCIQVATAKGIISKSGSWLSLVDVATGQIVHKTQGEKNLKADLLNDIELYAKFDYMLTNVIRGVEPKSVVDEWEEIKANEISIDEGEGDVIETTE